jgi:hypothetical protein
MQAPIARLQMYIRLSKNLMLQATCRRAHARRHKLEGVVESVGKWNPVAIRLRVLRRALFDESATQFAKRLGITATRLRNFEKGYPLSIDVAIKIRAAVPGMTPDWLYHGEERSRHAPARRGDET